MSTCHACGSSEYDSILSADEANRQLHRCRSCGFVYLASWEQSLRSAEELYEYYGRLSEEDLERRYSPENRKRQQDLLKALARTPNGRKLLDVGCGEGQLLQTARDEGWDAVGVDLSETAIRICQRRGLTASQTDFFDASLDARRFDVIVMSELIEHVPSPARFLKRGEELLEPGGILYLTTPNYGSLARHMLGGAWSMIHPQHIGYFERATLRGMVEANTTLHEIKIEANNITPSTIVAWLRRGHATSSREASRVHRKARRSVDQRLRRAVQRSRVLGASKSFVNRGVSAVGLGDTLVAWLQKP